MGFWIAYKGLLSLLWMIEGGEFTFVCLFAVLVFLQSLIILLTITWVSCYLPVYLQEDSNQTYHISYLMFLGFVLLFLFQRYIYIYFNRNISLLACFSHQIHTKLSCLKFIFLMWISSHYTSSKVFFLYIYDLTVYEKSIFSPWKKANENKTLSGKIMTSSLFMSPTTDAEYFPSWPQQVSAWSKLYCKQLLSFQSVFFYSSL